MRRHLLTLLSLLVLLMQPAALLHGLSHHHPAGGSAAVAMAVDEAPGDHGHGDPAGLDCLQCLAFAAIGVAALPATVLLWRAPVLRHAAPRAPARTLGAATGAGYHARGPPALA